MLLLQDSSVNGFFHFTAQGTGILSVISVSSFYIIRLLRKIDRGFLVFEWQHGLMWKDYVERTDRIPPFPHLSWEAAINTERAGLLGQKKRDWGQK